MLGPVHFTPAGTPPPTPTLNTPNGTINRPTNPSHGSSCGDDRPISFQTALP
jgi:hypothetical protein